MWLLSPHFHVAHTCCVSRSTKTVLSIYMTRTDTLFAFSNEIIPKYRIPKTSQIAFVPTAPRDFKDTAFTLLRDSSRLLLSLLSLHHHYYHHYHYAITLLVLLSLLLLVSLLSLLPFIEVLAFWDSSRNIRFKKIRVFDSSDWGPVRAYVKQVGVSTYVCVYIYIYIYIHLYIYI